MDEAQLLDYLMDIAEELEIPVRRVPAEAGSSGAVVTLKGRTLVFLDASSPERDQVAVLASALAGRSELGERFLPPEVREVIDSAAGGAV